MPDEPAPERRSWIRVNIDRSTSIKTTLFKFAPSLRIGSIFSTPLRAALATAVLVGGPAAGIMAAETTGATDLLDQDPQVISVTVLANEPGQVTVAFGADDQPTNIFDEIKAALEAIEIEPQVTVTVAAVSPEVAQFMTQIGTILDRLPTFFGGVNAGLLRVDARVALGDKAILDRVSALEGSFDALNQAVGTFANLILAAVEGLEFEPPPVNPPGITPEQAEAIIDGLEEVIDSQDVIEGAIFPGRRDCPQCPDTP